MDSRRLLGPDREDDSGWFSRERTLALVLVAATLLVAYLCYRLTEPFLPALTWALALAIVARPLHDWIADRVSNPNLAAGLAVVIVTVVLLGPALFVGQQLLREGVSGVQRVQTAAETGRWRQVIEHNPRLAPSLHWIEQHVNVQAELERLVAAVAGSAGALLGNTVQFVVQTLLMVFALFFFFRDRRAALQQLRSLLPLSSAETEEVFTRVTDTIHATIYGGLVVALIQGTLCGLMFWWLGLPAPLLWGAVMSLLALVPNLGAFVVWIPAAIFLALEGSWGSALILTAWGLLAVGLIDNLLYPFLVGNRLRLHTLTTLIAIVGGLALFGAAGLVLGPVIVAIAFALVDVWRRRTAGGRTAEAGVHR